MSALTLDKGLMFIKNIFMPVSFSLLALLTKIFEISFYPSNRLYHYIFSLLALVLTAMAFSRGKKIEVLELCFAALIVYFLMDYLLPAPKFLIDSMLRYLPSYIGLLVNLFLIIIWCFISGMAMYGLALSSYQKKQIFSTFNKVISDCKQKKFTVTCGFIPLSLLLLIPIEIQQKYLLLPNIIYVIVYMIFFISCFVLAYWLFKRKIVQEASAEKSSEVISVCRDNCLQKDETKVYRYSFLRKTSIVLLLLSPFITFLLFILQFIIGFDKLYQSRLTGNVFFQLVRVFDKLSERSIFYFWFLWLILSTVLIIIKKTENPGLITLSLIPLFLIIIYYLAFALS